MDISIKSYNQSFNFYGRPVKYTQEVLDKMLLPKLENKNLTKDDFIKQTNISFPILDRWFRTTFNKSLSKFFYQRETEKAAKDIVEYQKSGKNNKKIGDIIGKSPKWILHKLKIAELPTYRKALHARMDEEIPALLEAGYTIKLISQELNINKSTIVKWLKENRKDGIVKYRHDNNIRISAKDKEEHVEKIQILRKFFADGGTISEAIKIYNMSPSTLYNWIKKYNLKTQKKISHDKMKECIEQFMALKLSLTEMSKQLGLAKVTVARYIRKITGKSYKDIKKSM